MEDYLFLQCKYFLPQQHHMQFMERLLLPIYPFSLFTTYGCSSISMRQQLVNLCAQWIIRICLQNGPLRQSITLQEEESHA